MKIIKEGNWKMVWEMEMTCTEKSCGAVILVEEDDVKPIDYSSPDTYYCECVVCGSSVNVPKKDLPLRVQKKVNTHKKYSSCSWD